MGHPGKNKFGCQQQKVFREQFVRSQVKFKHFENISRKLKLLFRIQFRSKLSAFEQKLYPSTSSDVHESELFALYYVGYCTTNICIPAKVQEMHSLFATLTCICSGCKFGHTWPKNKLAKSS